MIVFDLICDEGHRFEGWFGNSQDFADQQECGLVACPQCGSPAISKAPMAPAVPAKGNTRPEPTVAADSVPVSNKPLPVEVQKALATLAKAQENALKNSTWVGDKFAEQSRAMHYGEQTEKPIHGRASSEEAKNLLDEGIAVAPLPFPIAPPDELN
ncbi:MAG: DUF1178 family protein [Alphaproteobacteria bacterium]|nr:MAG: DUF1178 family protein [Alphaproteobacteria bacterium]